ncbi:MAG TPA: hypothetical protein VL098_04860 [Flavipsychrobacter sp.]|nr:hypothetical protein [Flavipsychrobacter sp.]
MIIQSRFFISFLTCVTVTLRHCVYRSTLCLVSRGAIRVVFFIRDDLRIFIQLQAGALQVVAVTIPGEQRRSPIAIVIRVQHFQHGDASRIIAYMHRAALHIYNPAYIPAVALVAAQVNAFFGDAPCLLHPFADTLPVAVLVVSIRRALGNMAELVLRIPIHSTEVRHVSYIAPHILGIIIVRRAIRSCAGL